ncbi:MAG TPA: class I adenylate-forming enzyme family protein, partial [Steroidobacteraceae bacterium]|nr:class I adenylate-forming enzyme family protein [Steroidobacteraceae bacterium]
MNIVDPILFQAKHRPEAPALCAQGIDVISYARLLAQMNNVARRAAACGLARGQIVALSVDQPLLHAVAILGLTHAGIIPVSVGMHRPPAGLRIDAVLSAAHYPFAPQAPHLPLDYSWLMGDGAAVETLRGQECASDETCRIILTSGSTGDPKAVALTHRMVSARNARFDHVFGGRHPTFSRVYIHMGLAAALGYQFLIHILGRGGTVFFRGDGIDDTLRAFEVFHIQSILATPSTLAELLAVCDHHPSIDVHVDTIVSGGSLMPQALLERVRPRLCSHLVTGYGSTETAISATAPAHQIAHIEGAAGYVTPGIRIEVVDEADRPVPTGSEGIVRVASEFGVDCYIDDPVETAQVFRDGWFYPGDLGALTPLDMLIISGRRNEVLNAGGGKMAAEKIEAALTAFEGVSEAAVFMATNARGVEEVWAAVVCAQNPDNETLRALPTTHARGFRACPHRAFV